MVPAEGEINKLYAVKQLYQVIHLQDYTTHILDYTWPLCVCAIIRSITNCIYQLIWYMGVSLVHSCIKGISENITEV